MTFDPTAAHLAVELSRRAVESARPDAPTAPYESTRPARVASARLRLAGSLRTVAGWVEPRRAKVCQPS